VRLGDHGRRRAAGEGAVRGCARNHGAAEQKGQPALHGAAATVSPGTCLAHRRLVPERPSKEAARPTQTEGGQGDVIDYEVLLLLDAELPDERQSEIVTRTRELVEQDGGTFESQDAWGRRRLAYEIDHKPEGAYHLLTFSAEPGTLDEISRVLKITDGVMRHLAVRRPKPGATPTGPPPSADREAEYAEPDFEQSGDTVSSADASLETGIDEQSPDSDEPERRDE
jgi:small subunit ribosomal protein S6